jgi:hypothetical protein
VTVTSRVPAAIRAVRDLLVAGLPATTIVYTGPGTSDSDAPSYVFVGVDDPDETSYANAATGSQSWAQLGGKFRDEDFEIRCAAVAYNGDADILAAMDAVFATLAAVEHALVADPTLGGVLLYAVGISSTSLEWGQDTKGAEAKLPFSIHCRTRI